MALTLKRLNDLRTEQDEEEEKKKKLSGMDRLNAARGKTEEPAKKEEPAAPQQQLSGMERLNAAREKQKTEPQTAAPQISNTYREVDKENGRIRTRPADLSTPSWQDDPEEMAAELNMLGATLEDTGSKLTAMSSQRAMANSAVQNIGNEIKAYETKLGMLSDTMANSTDAGERLRAQQESKALDLYYQKAKLAQERYTARANELNSQFDTLAGQYESALQKYQAAEPEYIRRLGLGEAKAKEYEKQAAELREKADSMQKAGFRQAWEPAKQAEDLEAKAANSRGQYASYLYLTEGEEAANKYAAGEREKEETTSLGKKILNTLGGSALNFFDKYAGSPITLLADLMGMHEEAEILRNNSFNEEAQRMQQNAGRLGGDIVNMAGAAGHMMSLSSIGGMAAGAIGSSGLATSLGEIANSSPLVSSAASRAGAKLVNNLLTEVISNPGNAAISLSSGVSGYYGSRENGATNEQALTNGILKGLTEYYSNKMSSGMPFENKAFGGVAPEKGYLTQAIEYIGKKLGMSEVLTKFAASGVGKALGWAFDIGGEGMEEVITGIADPIIDRITYDKTADWKPKADQLIEEFEGGVLLALFMQGGEAALKPGMETAQIKQQLMDMGYSKEIANTYAPQIRKAFKAAEKMTQVVQKATERATPETTLARIVQKVTNGETLTGQDARKILKDPQAMQALMDGGYLGGKVSNDSEGRNKIVAAAEQYAEDNATQATDNATQGIDNAIARADNATQGPPIPEQGLRLPTAEEKAPVQESKLRLKGAEGTAENREGADEDAQIAEATVRALREAANAQPVQESKLRLKSAEETEIERDARAIQEYIDFANSERAAENNTQTERKALTGAARLNAARGESELRLPTEAKLTLKGTNNNGQTETSRNAGKIVLGGSGERGSGIRSGEQAGQVGRSPEGWRTLSRPEKAAARRAYADDVGVQPVQAKSLGVTAAAEDSTVRVYPREAWEPDLQRIAGKVEKATGKPVTFVLGAMKVNAGDVALTVRGVNTGKGIIVQADDPSISAEKIATHEAFHAFAAQDPELSAKVLKQIRQQFPENRLREIAGTYLDKLYGIVDLNSTDKAVLSRALERVRDEICADAYAGINAFAASADEYTGAARQAVTEARRETAAATERKTGPPESYSATDSDTAYLAAVEAGDMETAQRMVDEAAKAAGYTIHAYHGTGRADRVGTVFRADRATSGPMAFFTDNKEIAENYSRDKRDTSIAYDTDYDSYETQFRSKHTKTGKDFAIYEMWGYIPMAERAKIAEKAKHVRIDVDGDGEIIYDPEATEANGGWKWQVKEFHGNILKALNEQWLNSGNLFNEEENYLKVLELAGVTDALRKAGFEMPRYMNPDYREEAVYDVLLRIQNPFDATSMIDEDFIQGFEDFAADNEEQFQRESYGADFWDKNNVSAEDFVERMQNDLESGVTHAWTSIPDVMTEYLKSLDYDGIKDAGGKNGGQNHTVWIPFSSEQIKSADAVTYDNDGNVIPLSERFNPDEVDIRYSADEEYIPESAAEYGQMKRQGKTKAQKITKPVSKSTATIAKADLRKALLTAYSIPGGSRAEIGKMIDALADQYLKNRSISWSDREDLINKLWESGVMHMDADDGFQAVRELVNKGRIYVPESIKHEFGDDWNSFRREAMGEGIYLVNDETAAGWGQWNAELSDAFPGIFPEDEYDGKNFLERVVDLARKGKGENLTLAEYAAKTGGLEYATEEDMMNNLERQADYALKAFAEKANLEIYLKDRTGVKIAQERQRMGELLDKAVARERERGDKRVQAAKESGVNALAKEKQREEDRRQKEREHRKEVAQRLRDRQAMRELQQKTLKQLQWLSRNQNKFPAEAKKQVQDLLEDMDVLAVSTAEEMHIDNATGKTWKDLRDMYLEAKEKDPNWLPSAQLEKIVMRLDAKKIGDLDMGALQDLYKAAIGLRTELYNRNNLINDELHRTLDEVYESAKTEIQEAKGGFKAGLAQRYADMQLTPMNRFLKMAGWNQDSTWYGMAKGLEAGERAQRKFKTESQRQIAPVLEQYRDWMKTADGQGKNAKWYEIKVPESWEYHMGDKPIFSDKTVTVYMTPAQKVHMYLESKNPDNLRHMEGGRTFADKELYSKGKRAEAFANGTTVKLLPETVKSIVSDLTAEEQALANALEQYYNNFSKQQINKVSNILYGYDKAMGGYYAPIFTNDNYTKSDPGVFDLTAEGVGNLKERQHAANPSWNISAFDAFERSVDRTGKFVGLAIPIRNMNTLWNWRESGNSMKDVVSHKWNKPGTQFVSDLMTELQSGRDINHPKIEQLTNAALSRYIGATFGFNPSIVLKQFASFPLAGTYLGYDNLIKGILRPAADTNLISKYTGELDYRLLGYATPETATLKNNPNKLQEKGFLNFVFGGGAITWMDGLTVRTLWNGAEQKVKSEQPDLEVGTQEQIDAGQSPFYQAVAKEFEEAVSRSQPMYDTMHRADVMREGDPITRTFTLFKTVPMQELNMLAQTIGEANYYKSIGADKATQTAARQKAGRAFLGILTGNLMIGVISFLNALLKNKAKAYRDKDGELTVKSVITSMLKQYAKDAAGLVVGGNEVADILSAILFGDKWYGLETPGIEQLSSIIEKTIKASTKIANMVKDSVDVLENGGDWFQYMRDHGGDYVSSVEEIVRMLATYGTGLPVDNVKAYLLGAAQHISPAIKTAYEDIMSKADKSGLKGLNGAALEMRTGHILQDRAGETSERTVETIAGLYEVGYTDAVPATIQSSYSVNGETRKLSAADDQLYRQVWRDSVSGALDDLTRDKVFRNMGQADQAKVLKKLYDYGAQNAKETVWPDYSPDKWVTTAKGLEAKDVPLSEWLPIQQDLSKISGKNKKQDIRDYIDNLPYSRDQKKAMYTAEGYQDADEVNWHSGSYGGSSGKGKTYSMGGLRLSTPERREPTGSGLRLQSAPAAKPSSGGLRLK